MEREVFVRGVSHNSYLQIWQMPAETFSALHRFELKMLQNHCYVYSPYTVIWPGTRVKWRRREQRGFIPFFHFIFM